MSVAHRPIQARWEGAPSKRATATFLASTSGSLTWNASVTFLPQARAYAAVTVGRDGNIYVFGGRGNGDVNTTYIYNSASNDWSQGANMPTAREGAQAVTLPDGRIAVLGGGINCSGSNPCAYGTVYNKVEVYNPVQNTWGTLAPMQSPRYRFAAVLYQGQIYAIGGANGTTAISSVEAYNPSTASWSYVANLPQPNLALAATVEPGTNKIYVSGGTDGSAVYNTLSVYDGTSWTSGVTLPQGTVDPAMTRGADGLLYVMGGWNGNWLSTVQAYNPTNNTWSNAPSLPSAACCIEAVTAPTGQIYALGGNNGSPQTQVAVYGPLVALSPDGGGAGAATTLNGGGFTPGGSVTVSWGTITGTILAQTLADASGKISVSIAVPASALPGHHLITVEDGNARYPVTTPYIIDGAGGLTWDTGVTSLPQIEQDAAVATGEDGRIYVFGGNRSTSDFNTTYIYDPKTNVWTQGANMPTTREGTQAVTLPDGRIAVLGGGTGCSGSNPCSYGTVYATVEVYTPASNTWSMLAPMQVPRYRFAAVLYKGRIIAIGGADAGVTLSSVEAYDPATNTWGYLAALPQAEEAPAAVVDRQGDIDVVGGFDAQVYNTLFIYNGSVWRRGPSLPQATGSAGAVLGLDGRVFVIGGYASSYLSTVQAYNPATTNWSLDTSLPVATCCMGVIVAPSGLTYAIGGSTAQHQITQVAVGSSSTGQTTANTHGGGSKSVKRTYCIMADPVNCATGEFYETVHDLSVPGRGLPLRFDRTYSSLNAGQDGPLGHGWQDEYNMSLATDASGTMTVTEETGSSVAFAPDGSGGYQAPSRVLATLSANGDGTYTFARQDQQTFTFTAPTTTTLGQLVKETDRNGYATTLGYDANGRLSTVTDPAGRALTLAYNGAGRIARVVDPIGRTVAFTYSAAGDLADATDVGGGTTHYTYDLAGTHRLLTMTDPKGGVANAYDAAGRVTAQTDAMGRTTGFTYTANADGSQTTRITDPRGNVTVEQYMNNELLSLTKGYGTSQQATWTYTYDPATLGVASTTDPNGHTVYNTYDSRGNLLSHTDALSRTTSYAYDARNDTTAITDPLGVTTAITYDIAGNLLQTARPLTQTGQVALTTLAYDPAHPGDLIAKTDPNGHTAHYAYDTYGNLTSASDPAGDTTSYGYDLIGRKISVTDPRGNAPGANPISYTTTMTYNAFGQTTAITDPLGRVTIDQYDANQNLITAINPLGRQTVYGYDGNNHRTSVQRPDGTTLSTGYDPAGNVVTRTDALGHSTLTAYDTLNRVAAVTDPFNRVRTTQYDPAGNVITTTDPLGHQTVYGYDAANERTSIRHADGGIARTAYDLDGRIVGQTDPLGHTTSDTYDSLGRLTSVADPLARTTIYTYDLGGNKTAMADALSHVTTYQYDAADRLITTTDALNGTTILDYDPAGNTRARTDANGHTTRQIYDADNELIKVVRPDQAILLTQYDADGNAITRTNALGRDTIYGYDLLNRLTSTTDPRGAVTTSQYDAAGNVITQTDALGHQTIASYDATNEKTGMRQADGSTLRTAYDADGNAITQTDALSRNTVYGYDAMNRVVTTTDPLTRTMVYTYDLAGNKTALTDPLGRTTRYDHDNANELTRIGYSDGTTPHVAYTYTATGQRRTMADGTGTTTYQYDALDRPITVTNGANQSVGYGYDAVGNVTALTYPDASVVTRTYDALDRLASVQDWLGHTTTFGYDANSNPITETLPNTTSVVQGYNTADQLTAITDTQGGNPLWTYSYGRDPLGQVTSSADPLDGQAHSYGYSALNQLTGDGVTSGGAPVTSTWTVNGAYEIGQRVDPTRPSTSTLTYDPAHEVTGLSAVSGAATTKALTFAYNGDGDRTSQADSVSGAQTTLGYDQANRLTTAVISDTTGTHQATYTYDGDGLRAGKVIGTQALTETWDTSGQLPVLLQDGSTRYVTGPDGLPIEQITSDGRGSQVLYYLRDQLGSTRALLDGSGNMQATYTYDPYGNVTAHTGNATTPFQFAGQYTDAETGLQYLRARSYDPATGQFLSVDPLVDETKQPYAYVGNDPLNALDLTGLAGCNGASGGDFWARAGSSFGDLGCNLGEVKDTLLTSHSNGTTMALANEIPSLILGPATVAGGPSGPCDFAAYDAQANRDQQILDQQANNAAIVSTAAGGAGLARGVAGFARGFTRGLRGLDSVAEVGSRLAKVDPRKFSEYIFKPGATHGKDAVFRSLGYSAEDSQMLTAEYERQAAGKFASGQYTVGKTDQYGQRINIEIEMHGTGSAAGKTSYLVSGWIIREDGSITLNTPFSGFTRG